MATSSLVVIILTLLSPVVIKSENKYDYFYYNTVDNQAWQLLWYYFFSSSYFKSDLWNVFSESMCPVEESIEKCSRYRESNIHQEQGYLVLSAMHNGRHFSTMNMCTKEFFTYGRFDIRAAFPIGKHLRFQIYSSTKFVQYWHQNGQINVLGDIVDGKIIRGVHWANSTAATDYKSMDWDLPKGVDAYQFHLYAFEWEPERLRFGFDDHFSEWFPIGQTPNETLGPLHQLCFKMDVDIPITEEGVSEDEFKHLNWTCPVAVIDHLRFFAPFYGKREDALFPFTPINIPPDQKKVESEAAKMRSWCYTSLARSLEHRNYNVTGDGFIEMPTEGKISTLTWVLVIISAVLLIFLVIFGFVFFRLLNSKRKQPNPLDLQPDQDGEIYEVVDYGYHYGWGKDPYLEIIPHEREGHDDDCYLQMQSITQAIGDEEFDGYLPPKLNPAVAVDHNPDDGDNRHSRLVIHEHRV